MRHISVALTTRQIRARTKTVTRRLGWTHLQPGTLLQPVKKSRGLKKGERVEKIGRPIRVVRVSRERVSALLANEPYGSLEVSREGFGGELTPRMFVEFFCRTHRCRPSTYVTRIEFQHLETL
jgi:hypothetical protein